MSHSPTPKPRRNRPRPDAAPAPINVWPAWLARQPSRNSTGDQGGFSAAVTARLMCTYTRTGDLIVALHHHLAVAEAADWFARKATLMVTDRHQQEVIDRRIQPMLTPTRRATVRVVCAGPERRANLLEGSPGIAAMVIARLPEHPHASDVCESGEPTLHRLLDACQIALRPGGHLAIEVPAVDEGGNFADHATDVIANAKAAGLIYLQHLAVIGQHLSEGGLQPASHPGANPGGKPPVRRQHIDLYIFSKPGV